MQIGNVRIGTEKFNNPQAGRVYSVNDVSPTLSTMTGGGRQPMIVDNTNIEYRIRRLTPKETWRLMDFTDEQFDKAKESGISDTQLYRQSGNSIVVGVLEQIMNNLYDAMPYLFDNLKVGSYFSGIGAFESALDRVYDKKINKEDDQTECGLI